VQSYAGSLEFGLIACRRVLSQDESYELVEHLRTALRELEALPTVDAATIGEEAQNEPSKVSTDAAPIPRRKHNERSPRSHSQRRVS
jgi:diacylglycerol O-acyltransferase / wax synthase